MRLKQTTFPVLITALVFVLVFWPNLPAVATELSVDEINGIVASRVCRADYGLMASPKYPPCNDNCRGRSDYSSCMNKCHNDWWRAENAVSKWNAFVRKCNQEAGRRTPPAPPRPPQSSPTPPPAQETRSPQPPPRPPSQWSERLNEAQRRQQNADRDNQTNRNDAVQEAQDRLRQDRVVRERQAEQARRERMVCYGGPANVREGYNRCLAHCRQMYEGNYCSKSCLDAGSSDRHGQSCFKLP